MRVSVRGHSAVMDKAAELYPDYIKKLVNSDSTLNTLLRDLLVEMGLIVEIGCVVYEKDCGPYTRVEFDCPTLEVDYLDWT